MPKLNSFDIRIKTGERGRADAPIFLINTFPCDFNKAEGGTGKGEVLEAVGEPKSYAHSLLLQGPKEGEWDIAETVVTFHVAGEDPYTVRFGPITLDDRSDLNIWEEKPLPLWDV